ncbi:tetratricopeptide repeat protein [Luteimonas yindakuii]|uniref:Tetratricopeptide repeat protein n=2 Tax=Luteimonas yindakuii TaxID=2565782 RepID=A0A4Z1R670_9GAMM|nr:tetratricopeptide repeat protein [Luteimonas yindakuii]
MHAAGMVVRVQVQADSPLRTRHEPPECPMRPDSPAELETAEQLLRQGDAQAALRHASAVRADGTHEPGWMRLRALALAASGRAEEARALFAAYAQQRPGEADAWVNLGNACLDCTDGEGALQAFMRAGAAGAQGVPYLLGHGLALMAQGRFGDALAWLQRAQSEEPDATDVRLAHGQCLAELERYDDLAACVAAVDAAGLSFEQRTVLAWLLAHAGHEGAAQALFAELLAERPGASAPRVRLALLLERLNRVQEAEALLAVVGEVDTAMASMAALATARMARRRGEPGEAVLVLAPAADREGDPAMAAQLWFELAACHDRQQHADAAIQALARAHAHARRALRQRHPDLEQSQVLGWLRQRLHRPLPAPYPPRTGDPPDPVFLVGFPRSGTTLLEQMLGQHPALQVLDERPALERVIEAMRRAPGWRDDDLDGALARLDAGQHRALRAHYRDEVARHLPPGRRLVDKYPLYLTRAGYIQWLFPRSDWLLLLRHPCDCVLSCHFQAFGLNGGALAFDSLESTARTYAAVMGHWEEQRVLAGPRVHTLRYEDLAAAPGDALAALMAFLSLAPQPGQHAFHASVVERGQRIRTPSYAQVAEPVHVRAVGRWQRYRAHFSPGTLDLLAPFVERYGYTLD